jgi:large subunit ribosomal protein L6
MSRIGKKSITLPSGVEVKLEGGKCLVTGPKGKMEFPFSDLVQLKVEDGKVFTYVSDPSDRQVKTMWGTMRSLINNAITGVASGFEKKLEVIGVGYRVAAANKKVTLNLGYSHPIELAIPDGLEVKVEKNTLVISGIDRQAVGQFAAVIRDQRKPEPYKGKGIKYSDEVIRRKAGKVVKAVGGG